MCRVTKMTKKIGVKVGHDGQPRTSSTTTRTSRPSPSAPSRSARSRWPRRTRPSPPGASTATRSSSPRSPRRTGKNLDIPDANCRRVMDKDVADGVNKVLKSVMDKGTGRPVRIYRPRRHRRQDRHHDSNKAVWFAGYTPEIAGGVDDLLRQAEKPVHQQGAQAGYQGLHRSVDRRLPERLRQRRRRREDLAAGDAEVSEEGAEHQLQRAAAPDRGRQAGPGAQPLTGLDAAAKRKLEKAGFTVETALRLQRRPSRRTASSAGRRAPGSSISQFGTVFAQLSRGREPDDRRRTQEEGRRRRRRGRGRARTQQREPAETQAAEATARPSWRRTSAATDRAVGLALGLRRDHGHHLAHALQSRARRRRCWRSLTATMSLISSGVNCCGR